MSLRVHMDSQEAAIAEAITVAMELGAHEADLRYIYAGLEGALGVMAMGPSQAALSVLAPGYFPAFLPSGNMDRAKSVLPAIQAFIGQETVGLLLNFLERFEQLQRVHPEAAAVFGPAMCRLHPETVELA